MVLSHGTKVGFPLLTCRTSFDGSNMTKLSGKKPRRPFSSPSHQPSSSVSLTVRLKLSQWQCLWGRANAAQKVNRWSR